MLDIKQIREEPEMVRKGLDMRKNDLDLDALLALDQKRRALVTEVEELKKVRNAESKKIGAMKKAGEDAEAQMAEVRRIGEKISELDVAVNEANGPLEEMLLWMPNPPHPSTPVGDDDSANILLRTEGSPQPFDFEPVPHWDVGERLGIFEFKRAARMSGTGFPVLTGQGARLSRALKQFMLDLHTTEHGYTEVEMPFLVNKTSMIGTGQLPKMEEDMYKVPEDELYLIPTGEVPLTNLYGDEILEQPLPVQLTGCTACFRREAGAAGKDTRGMNRVHQFDKIELVKLVHPDTSYDELASLLGNAETVLQRLGLHYRVLQLCTGDLSFASAQTFDLELWAPGQQAWLEVSSCSNFEAFQARRANIRFRDENGKVRFVHTLNGSGTALPRLIVAILENGQQADGSVELPEALHPYMGGVTRLTPPAG